MNTDGYTTTIVLDATPEQIFRAINDVRGWWSHDIDSFIHDSLRNLITTGEGQPMVKEAE